MLDPFKRRPLEFLAHVLVLFALIGQFIEPCRPFIRSAHKAWILIYLIGFKSEGIRSSQAFSGTFYFLMSLCALFLENEYCLARLFLASCYGSSWLVRFLRPFLWQYYLDRPHRSHRSRSLGSHCRHRYDFDRCPCRLLAAISSLKEHSNRAYRAF